MSAKKRSQTQTILQAASLLLAYPDEELIGRLDVIEAAVAQTAAGALFAPTIAHLRAGDLSELQSFHVQEFDLSRRHAMHLSYWTDGDTRKRGEVLAAFKQIYRDSGLLVDLNGELPDHLPMVLEFTACDDNKCGFELLNKYRDGIELRCMGLSRDEVPHEGVIVVFCNCLVVTMAFSRVEVQRIYGTIFTVAPPIEQVGLETYQIQIR